MLQNFADSCLPLAKVHLGMLVIEICFGIFNIYGTKAMVSFEPVTVLLFRSLGSLPVATLLAILLEYDSFVLSVKNMKKNFTKLFLRVGLVQALCLLAYQYGLYLSEPINCSTLWLTVTPITVLLGMVFGKEKRSFYKIVGVAFAVGGALITLEITKYSVTGIKSISGDLLVIISTIGYSVYLTFTKSLSETTEIGTLTFSFWYFFTLAFWAMIASVPVIYTTGMIKTSYLDSSDWVALCITVFVGTTIPYCINNWVIVNSPPLLAAIYTPVELGVTMLLAAAILHEKLRWQQGLGAVFIVIGLGIVVWVQYREKKEEDQLLLTEHQHTDTKTF